MNDRASLLFAGGLVVDPARPEPRRADVLVTDGRVRTIGSRLTAAGAKRIDCRGRYLLPGFIDLHAHLREPGREDEETIATGARAALAGGFVTVCAMPNTEPVVDNDTMVRFVQKKAEEAGLAEVLVVGAVSAGQQGTRLSEIGAMADAGIVALSDDGHPVASAGLLRRALEWARMLNLVVISHCEDPSLSAGGVMHEGPVSTRLGLPGIPACGEAAMVFRDILLADYVGARLHIAHVSTRAAVEVIRAARARGSAVTAETCPHYLALTDADCARFDGALRVNPPLRSDDDRRALVAGLADGTLDAIATDHAPHLRAEKEVEFGTAPCGMIGLETAFLIAHEQLVVPRRLSLPRLAAAFTTGPARVLGRPAPRISEGEPAQLVVFNPARPWTYTADQVRSRSANTPFLGHRFPGRIEFVFHRTLHAVRTGGA